MWHVARKVGYGMPRKVGYGMPRKVGYGTPDQLYLYNRPVRVCSPEVFIVLGVGHKNGFGFV